MVSGVLHVVYSVTLQHGYDAADMNVVYPLARGTGPLLTVAVAVLLLGERPAALALAGALVIIAGVVVIATGRVPSHGGDRRAGLIYGIAHRRGHRRVHAVGRPRRQRTGGAAAALLRLRAAWSSACCWRRTPGGVATRCGRCGPTTGGRSLAVAVLSPLAYVLVLQAMRMAPVALVAPARETSIVIGSLLAWLVLHEPHPARRLVGSAVVLVGIVALVA